MENCVALAMAWLPLFLPKTRHETTGFIGTAFPLIVNSRDVTWLVFPLREFSVMTCDEKRPTGLGIQLSGGQSRGRQGSGASTGENTRHREPLVQVEVYRRRCVQPDEEQDGDCDKAPRQLAKDAAEYDW